MSISGDLGNLHYSNDFYRFIEPGVILPPKVSTLNDRDRDKSVPAGRMTGTMTGTGTNPSRPGG